MERYTRVKEVLREKRVTNKDVAEAIGITPGTLTGAINGNPTIGTLAKIAEALDVDVKELIK